MITSTLVLGLAVAFRCAGLQAVWLTVIGAFDLGKVASKGEVFISERIEARWRQVK